MRSRGASRALSASVSARRSDPPAPTRALVGGVHGTARETAAELLSCLLLPAWGQLPRTPQARHDLRVLLADGSVSSAEPLPLHSAELVTAFIASALVHPTAQSVAAGASCGAQLEDPKALRAVFAAVLHFSGLAPLRGPVAAAHAAALPPFVAAMLPPAAAASVKRARILEGMRPWFRVEAATATDHRAADRERAQRAWAEGVLRQLLPAVAAASDDPALYADCALCRLAASRDDNSFIAASAAVGAVHRQLLERAVGGATGQRTAAAGAVCAFGAAEGSPRRALQLLAARGFALGLRPFATAGAAGASERQSRAALTFLAALVATAKACDAPTSGAPTSAAALTLPPSRPPVAPVRPPLRSPPLPPRPLANQLALSRRIPPPSPAPHAIRCPPRAAVLAAITTLVAGAEPSASRDAQYVVALTTEALLAAHQPQVAVEVAALYHDWAASVLRPATLGAFVEVLLPSALYRDVGAATPSDAGEALLARVADGLALPGGDSSGSSALIPSCVALAVLRCLTARAEDPQAARRFVAVSSAFDWDAAAVNFSPGPPEHGGGAGARKRRLETRKPCPHRAARFAETVGVLRAATDAAANALEADWRPALGAAGAALVTLLRRVAPSGESSPHHAARRRRYEALKVLGGRRKRVAVGCGVEEDPESELRTHKHEVVAAEVPHAAIHAVVAALLHHGELRPAVEATVLMARHNLLRVADWPLGTLHELYQAALTLDRAARSSSSLRHSSAAETEASLNALLGSSSGGSGQAELTRAVPADFEVIRAVYRQRLRVFGGHHRAGSSSTAATVVSTASAPHKSLLVLATARHPKAPRPVIPPPDDPRAPPSLQRFWRHAWLLPNGGIVLGTAIDSGCAVAPSHH